MTALAKRLRPPLVCAVLSAAYVAFACVHARLVNVDAGRHDQSTYLWGAKVLHESHFAVATNRSQMPAFLYVQALFYPDGASDAEVFARAKVVSIALSVVLVGALCVFFARTLPKLEASVAGLVTAFTLFVFRAAYVQAELLFYASSFLGFAALCQLWERPSLAVAGIAGLLECLAFLSKGSVQPGVALFAALYLARAAWKKAPGSRTLALSAADVLALGAAFVAPLAPYLAKSKELYGSYFFNVNTRYVMWCDSWDDFLAREKAVGHWWTWGSLPESALPSMAHYLRTHSIGSMLEREALGVLEVLGNLVLGTGYLEFLALYLAFAAIASGAARAPLRWVASIDPGSRVAFVLPYALLYLGLFGFYAPIAAGPRFSLMLFLPVFYTLLRLGAERQPSITLGGRTVSWQQLGTLALALSIAHVMFVVPMTIGRIYAGG